MSQNEIWKNHLNYIDAVKAYLVNDHYILYNFLNNEFNLLNEKKLIQIRILIKSKKWHESEKLLSTFYQIENSFLEAEFNFLKSQFYGFNAIFESAIYFTHEALILYKKINYIQGIYICCYNLSVDYGNINLQQISHNYLLEAKKYVSTKSQSLQITRSLAYTLIFEEKNEEALSLLLSQMNNLNDVEQSEVSMFKSVLAEIYFICGLYDKSISLYKNLAQTKMIVDKNRILFNLHLIKIFLKLDVASKVKIDKIKLNIYDSSEYNIKLKIINAIIDLNSQLLLQEVKKLISVNSGVYQYSEDNFLICNDPVESKSIFYTTFVKLIKNYSFSLKNNNYNYETINKNDKLMFSTEKMSNVERMVKFFQETEQAISKDKICEIIWNKKYDKSLDVKIYKLIERVRNKMSNNETIILKNGAYLILRNCG